MKEGRLTAAVSHRSNHISSPTVHLAGAACGAYLPIVACPQLELKVKISAGDVVRVSEPARGGWPACL